MDPTIGARGAATIDSPYGLSPHLRCANARCLSGQGAVRPKLSIRTHPLTFSHLLETFL
ncbi:hypothetical protein [Microbacterium paulum]